MLSNFKESHLSCVSMSEVILWCVPFFLSLQNDTRGKSEEYFCADECGTFCTTFKLEKFTHFCVSVICAFAWRRIQGCGGIN